MRITILWAALSDYSVAFFRQLEKLCDMEIQLVYHSASKDAPFNGFDLSFCEEAIEYSIDIKDQLESSVLSFSPHCILMSSWNFKYYMRLARKIKKNGSYVISTIDHQWEGRLKQYLGVAISLWFLKPCIDNFLVAGDRQADFSRRLGFDSPLYGLYAADTSKFCDNTPIVNRDRSFLFVGRLVPVKGIDILIEGYRNYQDLCINPWRLRMAGAGDLSGLVKSVRGVEYLGFVQPDYLPRIMQQSRCFIIPSIWEPWGVVIHEATASGLPIIASSACGATTMFVRDGINGYVIPPMVEDITSALLRVSRKTDDQLFEMSKSSRELASLWSPERLAEYFHDRVSEKVGEGVACLK